MILKYSYVFVLYVWGLWISAVCSSYIYTYAEECEVSPVISSYNCSGYAHRHGRLRLHGTQLVNTAGQPVQLRGVSTHGLQWYEECVTRASISHLVEKWGINVLRAAVYIIEAEDGYIAQPDYFDAKLNDLINWTEELGIYLIIDWHVHNPTKDPNDFLDFPGATSGLAMDFWRNVVSSNKDKSHLMYEIANEPNQTPWDQILKYHNAMIQEIRKIDTETIIIVGTPFWSQEINKAASTPVDNPYNVMYTFHFYAASHASLYGRVEQYIDQIPIFVTEWGVSDYTTEESYNIPEAKRFLDLFAGLSSNTTVSWTVWQYTDKDELASMLTPTSCANQQWNSTTCVGTFIRNYLITENENNIAHSCSTPVPTWSPTFRPSIKPTVSPTDVPSPSPTLSPTDFPTWCPSLLPTQLPTTSFAPSPYTMFPSNVPTGLPTPVRFTCMPGSVDVCNFNGYCSASGDACVCFDTTHYWSSDQCSIPHIGPDIGVDLFCFPNSRDVYCSWLGTCDSSGMECLCDDPDHRSTDDRCLSWTPNTDIPGDFPCEPGSRGVCNNNGYCAPSGNECVCDDSKHYWPSEFCAYPHAGPELSNSQCCSPGGVDSYCDYLGRCNEAGAMCLCHDYGHRTPSERCSVYHPEVPYSLPDPYEICPASGLSPTAGPTVVLPPSVETPTLHPTMRPTYSQKCSPGDRVFCNNRGRCDAAGNACVCDDIIHFWSSDNCAIYHKGRELKEGLYCNPGAVDAYCNWLGTCSVTGMSCECFDPVHRWSSDRCAIWHAAGTTPSPLSSPPNTLCVPGERESCNNNGVCDATGQGCECDDTLHYWSSDHCSTFHHGPALHPGQCCVPGETDYYCTWMGTCDVTGTACLCFDPLHRLPSERCWVYHDSIDFSTVVPPPPNSTCPKLVELPTFNNVEDPESRSSGGSNENSIFLTYLSYFLPAIGLVLAATAYVVYITKVKGGDYNGHSNPPIESDHIMINQVPTDVEGGDTSISNSNVESHKALKKQSSLTDLARRSTALIKMGSIYEHIEDDTLNTQNAIYANRNRTAAL